MSMDVLTTALLDLAHAVSELPRPFLVGGGFGLYLKQRDLEQQTGIETLLAGGSWPPARATEDVDLLLPTEIIVDATSMQRIRAALDRLGFRVDVPNMQFVRDTPRGAVKIDFLTCDVPVAQKERVRMRVPRVRPPGNVHLHAYFTPEAIALAEAPFKLCISGLRSDGARVELIVFVPNPFTYLLMKLHAFRDRVDDARKQLSEHHAIDVYRIVGMLTRDEYDLVIRLVRDYSNTEPVRAARGIVSEAFATPSSIGMIRLAAAARTMGLSRSDLDLDEFVRALRELFESSEEKLCG